LSALIGSTIHFELCANDLDESPSLRSANPQPNTQSASRYRLLVGRPMSCVSLCRMTNAAATMAPIRQGQGLMLR